MLRLGRRGSVRGSQPGAKGRPVILATLGVPLDPEASAYAVESAVESGHALIVVNVTPLEPLPLSLRMGYDALEELTPEVSASLRQPAALAASLGVRVERLRVRSPRPVEALIELVNERSPGLLVFGPDKRAVRARTYQRSVTTIRRRATCLVWIAPDQA